MFLADLSGDSFLQGRGIAFGLRTNNSSQLGFGSQVLKVRNRNEGPPHLDACPPPPDCRRHSIPSPARPVYPAPESYPRLVLSDGSRGRGNYAPEPGQTDSKPLGFIPQVNHTYALFEVCVRFFPCQDDLKSAIATWVTTFQVFISNLNYSAPWQATDWEAMFGTSFWVEVELEPDPADLL